MHEPSELPCVMSARLGAVLVSGVVLVIGGVVVATSGLFSAATLLGVAVAFVGFVVLAWGLLMRRSRLRADDEGFAYRGWSGTRTISWNRLSSLQFTKNDAHHHATQMVVVNDMGRKVMQVPVHLFGRRRLHDWVTTLPTRSAGRENLLD